MNKNSRPHFGQKTFKFVYYGTSVIPIDPALLDILHSLQIVAM